MPQKILFVHGFLGFGSPAGGDVYWGGKNGRFVKAAQTYFEADSASYFTDFLFRYADISYSTKQPKMLGYMYAQQHYRQITEGLICSRDAIHIVSHSLGGAFSEGIMLFLQQQQWKIASAVYLNVWTPSKMNLHPAIRPACVVDATISNDWVQGLSLPRFGFRDIPHADVTIRKTSKKGWKYRHRDLIDSGGELWKSLLPRMSSLTENTGSMNRPEITPTVKMSY